MVGVFGNRLSRTEVSKCVKVISKEADFGVAIVNRRSPVSDFCGGFRAGPLAYGWFREGKHHPNQVQRFSYDNGEFDTKFEKKDSPFVNQKSQTQQTALKSNLEVNTSNLWF